MKQFVKRVRAKVSWVQRKCHNRRSRADLTRFISYSVFSSPNNNRKIQRCKPGNQRINHELKGNNNAHVVRHIKLSSITLINPERKKNKLKLAALASRCFSSCRFDCRTVSREQNRYCHVMADWKKYLIM
jgi:hypothetical protein